MNAKPTEKKIIIPHYGTLHTLGGLQGPVEVPFNLEIERIRSLVVTGVKVMEVLEDGTQLKLDRRNYDRDNSSKQKTLQKQNNPAPVAAPKEEKKQDQKTEFVKDNRNQDGGKKQKK